MGSINSFLSHNPAPGTITLMAQPASGHSANTVGSISNSVSHSPVAGTIAPMAQPASDHSTLHLRGRGTRGRGGRGRRGSSQPGLPQAGGALGMSVAGQPVSNTYSSAHNASLPQTSVLSVLVPPSTAERGVVQSMQAAVPTTNVLARARASTPTIETQSAPSQGIRNDGNGVHSSSLPQTQQEPSLGPTATVPANVFHSNIAGRRAPNFIPSGHNAFASNAGNQQSFQASIQILNRNVRSTAAATSSNTTDAVQLQSTNAPTISGHIPEGQPVPMYNNDDHLELADDNSGNHNTSRRKGGANNLSSKKKEDRCS